MHVISPYFGHLFRSPNPVFACAGKDFHHLMNKWFLETFTSMDPGGRRAVGGDVCYLKKIRRNFSSVLPGRTPAGIAGSYSMDASMHENATTLPPTQRTARNRSFCIKRLASGEEGCVTRSACHCRARFQTNNVDSKTEVRCDFTKWALKA